MQPSYDATRQHAYQCAQAECCTTADLAALALSCLPDAARSALKYAADAGYFRATLLPGFGNKIVYQPTPKAVHFSGKNIPKFLRAGLAADARRRGILRGFVRFFDQKMQSDLAFLTIAEQSALCKSYGIPERGHARALVGLDGAHSHIFVPVLKLEKPIAAIESACFRWLPLLESGTATLHFVVENDMAAALGDALNALAPPPVSAQARDELAMLDAEIAADKSGLAVLKNATRRAALAAQIEAAGESETDDYPWLGGIVEATL
jgi:hypothetical protein